MTDWAQIEK